MKYKKKLVLTITTIIIILIIGSVLLIEQKRIANNKMYNYKEIINKINSKQSFNLLIIKKDSELNKTFDYYEKSYSLDLARIYIDNRNDTYKKLIKKLYLDPSDDNEAIFQIIKNGTPQAGVIGVFGEDNIKEAMIKGKILSEEYKNIDVLITDKTEKYLKDDKIYTILCINPDNKNLYQYREELVKNKIPSLVVYTRQANYINETLGLEGKLDLGDKPNEKLPLIIKVKKNKVIYAKTKVKINELTEKMKQ